MAVLIDQAQNDKPPNEESEKIKGVFQSNNLFSIFMKYGKVDIFTYIFLNLFLSICISFYIYLFLFYYLYIFFIS